MNKMNKLVVGCCVALLVAACGGSSGLDGNPGSDGTNGTDGTNGAQGPMGPQGPQGSTGSTGAQGQTGAMGDAGLQGPQGNQGVPGDQGEQGGTGAQGDSGISLCGDVLFPNYHAKCGQDLVGSCANSNGEFECHTFLTPGESGDITEDIKIVCADATSHRTLFVGADQSSEYPGNPVAQLPEVPQCGTGVDANCDGHDDVSMPNGVVFGSACGSDLLGSCQTSGATWGCIDNNSVPVCLTSEGSCATVAANQTSEYPNNPVASHSSNRCDEDTLCLATNDNTSGAGQNVVWVVSDIRTLCPFDDSQADLCNDTIVHGRCRNATKHCLSNGTEGTVQADFIADPKESDMGNACLAADGQSVLTYECDTNADGTVSVQCTGPAQPQ